MKNSPAACATLGMSVLRLKLSVFMLSAAIAGLGRLPVRPGDRGGHGRAVQPVRIDDDADAARRRGRGLRVGQPRPPGCCTARCSSTLQNVLTKIGTEITVTQGLDRRGSSRSRSCCPRSSVSGSGAIRAASSSNVFAPWRPLFGKAKAILFAGIARRTRRVVPRVREDDQQLDVRAVHRRARARAAPLSRASLGPRPTARAHDETPLELLGIDRDVHGRRSRCDRPRNSASIGSRA